ncbi:MAG: hypothetical protein PHE99_07465 [Bacteroidales bacterium]|nr:hypothetical protein [Bacteroidales bacterium]
MKAYKYYILTLISVLLFAISAQAQLTVVGHVVAEVIDGASLSSDAVTELSINSADNTQNLDLGKITIKTGSSSACDIMLKPATLTNREGESIKLDAATTNFSKLKESPYSNNRTLGLTGNTTTTKNNRGTYQGSYTVVLAYN